MKSTENLNISKYMTGRKRPHRSGAICKVRFVGCGGLATFLPENCMSFVPCLLSPEVNLATICDPASAAVSPSVVVAEGNIALSAVGLMPPCGACVRGCTPTRGRARVLGTGLGVYIVGKNIVSISKLLRTRNGHDGTAQQLLYVGDQRIYTSGCSPGRVCRARCRENQAQ